MKDSLDDTIDEGSIDDKNNRMFTNNLSLPPLLRSDGKDYIEWKTAVRRWSRFVNFKPEDLASILSVKALSGEARSLALSLPDEKLIVADGLTYLLNELDKLFLKDKDSRGFEAWKNLACYKRGNKSILDYCVEFRRIRREAEKFDITISNTTFAYLILDNCGLSNDQQVLVLSIALSKSDGSNSLSPDHVEGALRRINCSKNLDDGTKYMEADALQSTDMDDAQLCLEDALRDVSIQEKDELFEQAMAGWTRNSNQRGRGYNSGNFNQRGRGYMNRTQSFNTYGNRNPSFNTPRVNMRDIQTGEIMKCYGCGSRFHLFRSKLCPNFNKSNSVNSADFIDCEENLLVTSEDIFNTDDGFKYTNSDFVAILDSAATKTVMGHILFSHIRDFLENEGKPIYYEYSNSKYKFGNDGLKNALFKAIIPITIFNKSFKLHVDIIQGHCPLLLSKQAMCKLGIMLKFESNFCHAIIDNCTYLLSQSNKGHLIVPIFSKMKVVNNFVNSDNHFPCKNKSNDHYFSYNSEECFHVDSVCDSNLTDHDTLFETFSVEDIFFINDKILIDPKHSAKRLHRIFGHPNIEKMLKTIDLAFNDQNKDKVIALKEALKNYSINCEICCNNKKHVPPPRVTLPSADTFNDLVAMDITFWPDPVNNDKHMILHLIDMATRFSLACVILSKDPDVIVNSFISLWVSVMGPPSRVQFDNGGEFFNDKVIELLERFNINVRSTAAQAPFSNGINERHNGILKEILTKVRYDYNINIKYLLSYAIFAKNALLDRNGFSPFQRVYGRNPLLPKVTPDKPCSLNDNFRNDSISKHLNLLHSTRLAYLSSEASERLKRAFNNRIFMSQAPFIVGERVYFWRSSASKSLRGWRGPANVIGVDGSIIILRQGGYIVRCHHTHLRRVSENGALIKNANNSFTRDNYSDNDLTIADTFSDMSLATPSNVNTECNTGVTGSSSEMTDTSETNNDPETNNENLSDTPEIKNDNLSETNNDNLSDNPGNIRYELRPRENLIAPDRYSNEQYIVYHTESFDNDLVQAAKLKEIKNWQHYGVYEQVSIDGVFSPPVSTRWVVTSKIKNDLNEVKARLVIKGFEDVAKDIPVSESPTIRRETLKSILAILPSLKFVPKALDISCAFLQGGPIGRDVFVRPPPEANCPSDSCWKLKKCAYGLCEASRLWYDKLHEILVNNKMIRCKSDPALYLYFSDNILQGIVLVHVDDILYSGSNHFEEGVMNKIISCFDIKKKEVGTFVFCGLHIETIFNGSSFCIRYSQPNNLEKIEPINIFDFKSDQLVTEPIVTQYRSLLGSLQWVSNITRPDLCFGISYLMGKVNKLTGGDCLLANKLLRKAKGYQPTFITFSPLDLDNIEIVSYTDAGFGNLSDLGSQGGQVCFISDGRKVNVLDWKSHRIKRICKSTFAAELLSFGEACDYALFFYELLNEILVGFEKSIRIKTDSKGLYDNLRNLTGDPSEKRLRLELAQIRELTSTHHIQISWIPTLDNLADVLTKEMSGHNLLSTFENGQVVKSGGTRKKR